MAGCCWLAVHININILYLGGWEGARGSGTTRGKLPLSRSESGNSTWNCGYIATILWLYCGYIATI